MNLSIWRKRLGRPPPTRRLQQLQTLFWTTSTLLSIAGVRSLSGRSSSTSKIMTSNIRGVFCGSGSDGMSDPRLAECIMKLLANRPSTTTSTSDAPPTVLYLGTATYDIPQFATRQTERFRELGCKITTLELIDGNPTPTPNEIQNTIEQADIIVVGGGNTLFALDRWDTFGVAHLLKENKNNAILTGGSAGAICWFDGGHSDSFDPDTYKKPMLEKFGGSSSKTTTTTTTKTTVADESSTLDIGIKKEWNYIRVSGLGILPGLVCPHHDKIQSNGKLRAHDFDEMLLKHPDEIGIGIDHWAALVVEGNDQYSVLSLDDKPGSVLYNEAQEATFSPEAKGIPGIWIKRVVTKPATTEDNNNNNNNSNQKQQLVVESRLCPPKGKLSDILKPATNIIEDIEDMNQCRNDNPQ